MGTIPAPNIVADAAQISQNPLTEYARSTQLNEQQQQFQQEKQQRDQQIELQRRQLADQDAVTKAMGAYNTEQHTPDDIPKLILQNGGSGGAAMAAQQHILGLKKTASEAAKDDAESGSKNIDTYLKRHDAAAGELQTHIASDDDASLGKNLFSSITSLGQNGYLRPDEVQHGLQLAQLAETNPQAARAQLPAYLNSFKTEKQIFEEAQKTAQQNTQQQEANAKDWKDFPALGVSVNTRTGEQRSVSGGAVMSPEMMSSKYVALQQKQTMKQPIAPEDKAWMRGYEKLKTLVPVANFNLQNSGAAADGGGNPSQIAQAIANGQMAWKDAVSVRTPMATKNAILSQVFKLNPSFDTSEFGLETDAAKKARSGVWADTRVAYNTAIDHSKQLLETIDAMNNTDVKKLNSLKNFFKTEFGSEAVPDYSAVANAYNHEVTSVVSKGHITDAEVAQGGSVLPSDASPQALRGVINNYNRLMQSKRDELDKVIKAGAGNKANSVLNVKGDSEGGGGGSLSVKAPNGKTYTFKDQQSLDNFKRAAGIQ
jgi:hypothetical protein